VTVNYENEPSPRSNGETPPPSGESQFRAFDECAASEAVAPTERPKASQALVVLATIAVLVVLYVARDVITPVVLALLLALLLRPLLRRMKRWHIPHAVSAFVLVAVVVAVFLGAISSLAGQAQTWLGEAPRMVQKVTKMMPLKGGPLADIKETSAAVAELTSTTPGTEKEPLKVQVQSHDMAYTAIGLSSHFVAASVIVFVVAFFLLALSDQLLKQTVEAMPTFCEKRNVVQLVQNVEQGISRYLATITVINICLGIVAGIVMWLMKIPNPVLWGVMVATLNYVPHVGAFICLVVLFFVGTITHQSLWYGAATAGAFVCLTSAESYFITPMALSKSLQLSPLAVILSILFWGWMWGVLGGLLAAPMLAAMKIVCDQFESTRPVSLFLSGETASTAEAKSASHSPSSTTTKTATAPKPVATH
jgi:predicted PurR-regulated permease PerM